MKAAFPELEQSASHPEEPLPDLSVIWKALERSRYRQLVLDPLGQLATLSGRIADKTVAVAVMSDGLIWFSQQKSSAEKVLCFKDKQADCNPCHWSSLATLPDAADPGE